MKRPPAIEYENAPCSKCGATNARDAETLCQPTRDFTDEYVCPATDCKEDFYGNFMFPTAASIAAIDKYYEELTWESPTGTP